MGGYVFCSPITMTQEIPMTRTHLTKALLDKAMKSLDRMDGWSDKQRCQLSSVMVEKGLIPTPKLFKEEAHRRGRLKS